MGWTVQNIPNQVGRVAFVTGANSGLGLETVKALVEKGATVVMGCRSIKKADAVRNCLNETVDMGQIDLIEIDLADLRKVTEAADQMKRKYDRLDLLINNAGVMAPPRTLSKQGLEIQFGVNHLAHMALTIKLLPLLSGRRDSRVVTVTSGAQYMGKINWDDLQGEKNYNRWACYSQSKLANVMFALELDKRIRCSKIEVASLAAHPGLARTNLQSTSVALNRSWYEPFFYKLMEPLFQSASMGALPQLFAATEPQAKSGEQYGPRLNFRGDPTLSRIAPLALSKLERQRLWDRSARLIKDLGNIDIDSGLCANH